MAKPVIADEVVLDPDLPIPSVCLRGKARREVRVRVAWRQCKK